MAEAKDMCISKNDKMHSVMSAILEERFPSSDRYSLIVPFKDSPNLCVVKVDGFEDVKIKFSTSYDAMNGLLFDWMTGVEVLSNDIKVPIITTPHLPVVNQQVTNFEAYTHVQMYKDAHTGEDTLYALNIDGSHLRYFATYPGKSFRIFKYSNKVYMLSRDGRDATTYNLIDSTTPWALFQDSTGLEPTAIFDSECPYNDTYYTVTLGTVKDGMHTSRTIVNNYAVLTYTGKVSASALSIIRKDNVASGPGIETVMDHTGAALGSKSKVLLSAADINVSDANVLHQKIFHQPKRGLSW